MSEAGYLSWPVGGAALAAVGLGHWLLLRQPMGVSSLWARLAHWREEGQKERAGRQGEGGASPASTACADPSPLSRLESLVFLLATVAGGLVVALVKGTWAVQKSLGPVFDQLTGGGLAGAGVLLLGGVLVGLGTRLAKGCTSGHGLNGCGYLQPASLLNTVVFLGTAIGFSWLLKGVWS